MHHTTRMGLRALGYISRLCSREGGGQFAGWQVVYKVLVVLPFGGGKGGSGGSKRQLRLLGW